MTGVQTCALAISSLVVEALGVPIVTDPVYPYDESPPIDEVMSHITRSSI